MKQINKVMTSAVVLSGAIGLTAAPAWSQWSSDAPYHQGSVDSGASRPSGQAFAGHDQETIRDFQQALKEKGHDPGPIDGVMGPNTRQALREFQKESNIKATGVPNEETAEKLGISFDGDKMGSDKMGSNKMGSDRESRKSGAGTSEPKRQGSSDTFNPRK